MAVEARRGCGFRKVGGIYLVGKGVMVACDRLPWVIRPCPTCGCEIQFSRGFQWLDPSTLFGQHEPCSDRHKPCPICQPNGGEKYGLMWVGEQYYTAREFVDEALKMGVSKRIGQIPTELKLGKTYIVLAHKSVPVAGELVKAIFYGFMPQAIEKIITESQSKDPDVMRELKGAGITPVIVPDDDPDHCDVDEDDDPTEALLNFEMKPAPEWN